MAIQHRRGNYADFDPTKMVAGEPAVVLGGDPTSSDGKAAYIAFGPGSVKKLATAEDMRDEIYNQTQSIIQEVEESLADDVERAESAAESVSQSAAQIAQNTQDISDIKADLSKSILLWDNIPDTTQTYTFVDGTVSQVTHFRDGTAVRTDAFTYGDSTITEVRTMNTGESLTIATNLTTLETSVTYAAA